MSDSLLTCCRYMGMCRRLISSICAGLPPPGQTTATSGRSATSLSMSIATTSPMRGTCFAAGGSSEYSTVAMTCLPAPAANSISVAPGARLTMRVGVLGRVTVWPVSSVTVTVRMRLPPVADDHAGVPALALSHGSMPRPMRAPSRREQQRRRHMQRAQTTVAALSHASISSRIAHGIEQGRRVRQPRCAGACNLHAGVLVLLSCRQCRVVRRCA